MRDKFMKSEFVLATLIAGGLSFGATAADSEEPVLPLLGEVLDAIGSGREAFPIDEIDTATVRGIVERFGDHLALIEPDTEGTNTVSKVETYDEDYLRITVKAVEHGLAGQIRGAIEESNEKKAPRGVVVDLRYATGRSYPELARVAGLFAEAGLPVIEIDGGMIESENSGELFEMPVIVLVNGETSRAAEALAAVLRHSGNAIVIGQRTAGKAWTYRETVLSSGQKLQIADGDLKLGDGSLLSRDGVRPDIEVKVDSVLAGRFFKNPYHLPEESRPVEPLLNEAELVRRHNSLVGGVIITDPRMDEVATVQVERFIRDPVLGRALDLLKGLVLFR